MECPHCGGKIKDSDAVCQHCGQRVASAPVAKEPEKKKKIRMIPISLLIPLICIVCSVLFIVIARPSDEQAVEPTATEVAVVEPTEAPGETSKPEPTVAVPTDTPIPEPTVAPTATPETQILLSCQDCAEEGILINIWDKPGGLAVGPKVLGEFEQLTVCVLLDETTIDDFLWYKVVCDSVEGWLSHRLVEFMGPTDTSISEPTATGESASVPEQASDDCDITELSVWWLVTAANQGSMVEISEDNIDEFRLKAWTAYQIQKDLPYPSCAIDAHLLTVDYFYNSYEFATSLLVGDQDKSESFAASAIRAMDELRISLEKLGLEFESE